MKEFIGFVTMKIYSSSATKKAGYVGTTSVHVTFDKECYEAINSSEVVFKPRELKISVPTIDDYKRYQLSKNKKFGFGVKDIPNEEFVGKYKMYKKEEYFILKKIKEK